MSIEQVTCNSRGWPRVISKQRRESFVQSGMWEDTTITDRFWSLVQADPDRIFVLDGDLRVSRRELWQKALRLARSLHNVGLSAGDVVSFQLPNWVEAAVINLSSAMLGLVVNPI